MKILSFFFFLIVLATTSVAQTDIIVAKGNMPNMAVDLKGNVHIVFGKGDSLMYVTSVNGGKSFSDPTLVALLPGLFANAMRGPQVATTSNGVVITACNKKGNIYSYKQEGLKWIVRKVNDVDETAKEALMGLAAEGNKVFAVWLSVKDPKGQYVYGARSDDGGSTWKRNVLVYDSPDKTVCECCKPSVAVKNSKVYVMFRNSIDGNRDLYLAESNNGEVFNKVHKLGTGSWKLNACPMDGGGLAINDKGIAQTVWRREGKIYAATTGSPEIEIGEGRSCTIATVKNKNIYAWTEKGEVIIKKPSGGKMIPGKGSLPIVKVLNNDQCICIWENNNEIHASVINI